MKKPPETEILCTLGPSSMNPRVIRRLEGLGVFLFRINLSHTRLSDLEPAIDFIQAHSSVPVCLDTEGAQIRTGDISNGQIDLHENTIVHATQVRVPGDSSCFNFVPLDTVNRLNPGDFLSIDFNSALVQVIDTEPGKVTMRVLNGGPVGKNKAVTLMRDIDLPPLTEKDRAALEIGLKRNIRHFALSFANHASDLDDIRAIVGADSFVISKIECLNGLKNFDAIAERSDALLIDRGDLSREVPLEHIPSMQKQILTRGAELGKKVYVATNLLESMITLPMPTRAEVNDIFSTLENGAAGLVLAAETAIGAYPIQCASIVIKMAKAFEAQKANQDIASLDLTPICLLVPPHGDRLVDRVSHEAGDTLDQDAVSLQVSDIVIMDCEQIAIGTFSPLTGFMDQETLWSVLDHYRLVDGTAWTLPVPFQVSLADSKRISAGSRVALLGEDGNVYAVLDVTDVYTPDKERVAKAWFGTVSLDHPGVARLFDGGDVFVGGDVTLVRSPQSPYQHYSLTPAQTRFLFTHKGWTRVVGFHGRNPAHRVHEFIQMQALERSAADGLFISPVLGPKKTNDFLPGPIMESYRLLLESGIYPKERVLLGGFSTYSRYSGPREAVFTALCRKNMGCSDFIIGRDHTGVGDFYPPDASRRLFDELGDIGINPIFFGAIGFNSETEQYEESGAVDDVTGISGTEARLALAAGIELPEWYMREIVQEMIRDEIASGRPVFSE